MSKSSQVISGSIIRCANTFISTIFHGSLRRAAPILFCVAILLFFVTLGLYALIYVTALADDSTQGFIRNQLIVEGIMIAFERSALPFAGAALIWTIGQRESGAAE